MMVPVLVFLTLLLVQVSIQHSVTPRITNGLEASLNQFQFIASIQFSSFLSLSYYHKCGATVIDEYWVLSSAICVNKIKKFGRSRVKISMFFTYKKDSRVQVIKITHKIVHENFSSSSDAWNNDIGLLKLKNAIINYVPARLPQPGSTPTGEVFIIGWGVTFQDSRRLSEVLQYGHVEIIENQSCQSRISNLRPPALLQDTQICTISSGRSTVACAGDGGGPIIHYVNDQPVIVGVINWTLYPCGKVGAPTVSTKVSDFIEWINENIEMRPTVAADRDSLVQPLLLSR